MGKAWQEGILSERSNRFLGKSKDQRRKIMLSSHDVLLDHLKQSFQFIIMSTEQPSIKQQLLQHKHNKGRPGKSEKGFLQELKLFMRLLCCFQRNYEGFLLQVDPAGAGKDAEFVSSIPGYRKHQLIFLFYLRRFGLPAAFLLALLFPLPLTALFLALAPLLSGLAVSGEAELVLIGLRCSVLSYLCRYCLHFPEDRLNWMIYLGSMACAAISSSSFTLIAVYALALCFSYFRSKDAGSRESLRNEQEKFGGEREQLERLAMPRVRGWKAFAFGIAVFFVGCWMLQRTYVQPRGQFYLVELFLVSLLGTNQELASFFPGLCGHLPHPHPLALPTANVYALGYLLPGLHLKTFFLLLAGEDWLFLLLSYLAVHLPSLLVLCVGLGRRQLFLSVEWGRMRASVQAVSNGLVLVGVGRMLGEEHCHLHIAFFTTLVIFTVTKLYKFNEIISALLGVFLVASRAAVLHLNNKKTLSDFLCRQK